MSAGITVHIDKDKLLSDEQWDQIADIIAEKGTAGLKTEVLDQALYSIQAEAQNFLDVYNSCAQDLDILKNKLQNQKKMRTAFGKKVAQAMKEYQDCKAEVNKILNDVGPRIYTAVFSFQQKLNNFLGQHAVTIIVYQGELYRLDTDKYEQMIKYDYNKNSLTARYDISQANLRDALQRLDLQDYNESQLARVRHGYNSAIWRFNYSKQHRKGVAIVMWRNPEDFSQWVGMSVSSTGDIAEAYANIILDNHLSDFPSDVIENILQIYMLDYVSQVNTTSGMLQGDVSVGNIEYAIKTIDASALGFRQFKTVAEKVVLQKDFSQQSLKDYQNKLREKGKKRNKFMGDMTDQVSNELENAFALGEFFEVWS